jgi:hypothetical protein
MRAGRAGSMRRTPVQAGAVVVAVVFLVVGILGFVPGITTHYGDMGMAGHSSGSQLLGVFEVSVLHNIVHLLFGAAGLILARTPTGASSYLLGGGLIFLVLWLYGLVIEKAVAANFVPMNGADDWLHFALGVVMVGTGLILGPRSDGQH